MIDPSNLSEGNGLASAISALANAIQTAPSFQQWRAAAEALESDSELRALIDRYNKLASGWEQSGGDDAELTEVADQIQGHQLYLQRERAGAGLARLFQQLNVQLSDQLGVDFATTAIPPKCGCCG